MNNHTKQYVARYSIDITCLFFRLMGTRTPATIRRLPSREWEKAWARPAV